MKKAIAVAGTILVDRINEIERYPKETELAKIISVKRAVGGCVPNVAIDIKKIDKNISVYALGKIGVDDDGAFLEKELSSYGIETSGISKTITDKTSYTDVMSVIGGQRTFFTYAGACSDFGIEDVNLDNLSIKMLHLGYFLLLDKVDNGDGLKLLKEAKNKGITTSIDLVSDNGNNYKKVLPCLEYTDNLIINEIEAGKLTDYEPTKENIKTIAKKLKELGVKERVIIHMPDYSVCYSNNGFTLCPSYQLPEGYIKGSTGAGDAFCAGALVGIYGEKTDKEILEFASAVAVLSLSQADAVSGVTTAENIIKECKNFSRKNVL